MTQILETAAMHEKIFEARIPLVRLCRSLTGDTEAAEDLAQETLAEAWRHRDKLRDPDAAASWLTGIARNVCRRHAQRAALRQTHEALDPSAELRTGGDPWEEMEQAERAGLLDRAMGLLPAPARAMLAARYWDEMPLSEIAARAGCTENTAAVRLRRAREALRGVLAVQMQAEAAAFGLAVGEAGGWQPTRVWCFRCGQRHLDSRFEAGEFAVRCSLCDGAASAGEVAFSTRHTAMEAGTVLGAVRGGKPALRRVSVWWDARLQRGLSGQKFPCWRCAKAMARQTSAERIGARAFWYCGHCGADFSLPASGLAFHAEPTQRFWQRHPRIQVRPERRVLLTGRAAIITRFEAADGAAIERVYDAQTFQPLQAFED